MSRIKRKQYFADRTITEMIVSQDTEAIEEWAFASCSLLSEIRIPIGCSVSDKAFAGCDALERIFLYEQDPYEPDPGISPELLALSVLAWPQAVNAAFTAAAEQAFLDWFDPRLSAYLKETDESGFSPFLAGGEEDYDEEGSEREDYVSAIRIRKAKMIFERFLISTDTINDARKKEYLLWLKRYNPEIPFALIHQSSQRRDRYENLYFANDLHLECDTDRLLRCADKDVQLRTRILSESGKNTSSDTFLDALKL